MKCTIRGCAGDYEERLIVHSLRHHGQIMVIDHVPAEVCTVCGDTLLRPETIRRIEQIMAAPDMPSSTVPLFEFAS